MVPETSPPPNVNELRRALLETLPDHMIPSVFVYLSRLPLTSSGKFERQGLPESDRRRPEVETKLVLPRNASEAQS